FVTPTPPAAIYPLSLHDALPICPVERRVDDDREERHVDHEAEQRGEDEARRLGEQVLVDAHRVLDRAEVRLAVVLVVVDRLDRQDRKSTRLNSSHVKISYAVFCL